MEYFGYCKDALKALGSQEDCQRTKFDEFLFTFECSTAREAVPDTLIGLSNKCKILIESRKHFGLFEVKDRKLLLKFR